MNKLIYRLRHRALESSIDRFKQLAGELHIAGDGEAQATRLRDLVESDMRHTESTLSDGRSFCRSRRLRSWLYSTNCSGRQMHRLQTQFQRLIDPSCCGACCITSC